MTSKKIKVERINCTKKKKEFPMSETLHDFRKAEKKSVQKTAKVRKRETELVC